MSTPAARSRGINIFDETRPMWRLFIAFLLPLMLSNILQSIAGTLNSVFLGRMIGVKALGAASAFFPILFFLISFFIGLSSGATVLIGQAFGARDVHTMKRIVGTTLSVALLLGIGLMVVGLPLAEPMLRLLGTPSDILAMSITYAKLIFVAMPLIFLFFAYVSFLRGLGDTTTPLWTLVLTAIIGVIVTPALIQGWFGLPRLGIASAAVATIVANAAGLIVVMLYLRRIRHPLSFDLETARDLIPDPKLLLTIMRIGVPTGLQVIMVSLSEIAVLSFVNRFGSSATAAYGAVNQVASYVQFPAISIAIATSIFGAQSIGARRLDLLPRVLHSGVMVNYLVEGPLIVACYALSWIILGWFITDPGTLNIAHSLLMITLWSYALYGNAAVLSGLMRSSGTVVWPTTINILAIWLVEVPVAYVLMHRIGLDGVWIGYPAAFCVMLTLQTAYYLLVWKGRQHERLI